MITNKDFSKKQIVYVLCINGEKFCIKNDNLVVLDSEEKIKLQVTCYRLFLVNVIGNFTITNVLIKSAKKFGFFIALFTPSYHLYQIIGAQKDGNYLLKKKQYSYNGLEIAKRIVKNKIVSEYEQVNQIRGKQPIDSKALLLFKEYYLKIDEIKENESLLAYEGISAKVYFNSYFKDIEWTGRKPRMKRDIVNSTLDIGYTMLFNYLDALLLSFGFDTYVGIYHKQFYMRKSLTCDLVEPFRIIIDHAVHKAYNLGQIKTDDFILINGQYKLKWEANRKYIAILMEPILENKDLIFKYVQDYYRCFMKETSINNYPFISKGEILYGSYKL